MDLQLLGPPGAEINLRDIEKYILEQNDFQSSIQDDLVLTKVPGGVLLTRDNINYEELTRRLVIFGSGRQEMRENFRAIETILMNASLYDRSRGFSGEAAFYTERLGDESSAKVRQILTGRIIERNREGGGGYLDCTLRLILRNPL